MIDPADLLTLLLIKKELIGYPGHVALNYMIDAEIKTAEEAAMPEMTDAQEAKKAAAAKAEAAKVAVPAPTPKAIPSAHFPEGHHADVKASH